MIWLAGVIGLLLGALFFGGYSGGLAGAALGFIIGLALRSRQQGTSAPPPLPAPPAASSAAETARASARAGGDAARGGRSAPHSIIGNEPAAAPIVDRETASAILQRIDEIDRRLAAIEARLPALGDSVQRADDGSMQRSAAALPTVSAEAAGVNEPPPVTLWTAPIKAKPHRGELSAAPTEPIPAVSSNALWAWFTGGNTLTRVGVVVLFFGVGFLLKYFAEHFTISIEWRLLAVALAGGSLVALGAWLARERPAYGLSLQGLGAGILYLTTFAALRLYAVLPAAAAFALLVAIAALTVALAVRANSQPLAGLAIAGGFLAPFLVTDRPGAPALLFGYFAVLNAAIFALAWFRAWRALNVLGFVFTFALGSFWGHRHYSPQYFSVVEPYLILFFVFYVTIAVLYAKQAPLAAKAPVDALLVFGVPLVGFALQAALVRDFRYGVAISAFAIAAVYSGAFILLRRPEPRLALLSRTFLVLAIIFATIAIPFAVDARWTSAWWALEAAAVYWIGCRQRQPLARAFALLLQIGAGVAFVLAGLPSGERLFANASFLGTTLIALAALSTTYIADGQREEVSPSEQKLVPVIFGWGVAWWVGGGMFELHRQLNEAAETTGMLAWVTGSVMLALTLQHWLRWSRLVWFGAALLPAMALAGLLALRDTRTTLLAYGWLLWPLAWITQWQVLHAADALPPDPTLARRKTRGGAALIANAHTMSAIALVAWSSWEASEWAGRWTPGGTVWIACAAAVPAIVYLASMFLFAERARWPFAAYFTAYADAYTVSAGTTVAALLSVWFVLANIMSPGNSAPLPYVPLANPLDLTLLAALAVLFLWARRYARMEERALYGWLGAALFLLVNAIVFRAVHQWFDVPWRWSALFASRTLQAGLTLTWTVTALPLMLVATRRGIRPLWILGAALLAVVVGKLFLMDLAALSGLPRIVAFLGAGVALLVIGYFAPLPPATGRKSAEAKGNGSAC
ncbi:MAG: DUF2339 domain-containing protein [Casimicrobiaceae bacterium]